MKRHYYTEEERNYLKQHYPHVQSSIIAEKLGVSVKSIWNQANAMGLKKTKECVAKMGREKMADPNHPGRKHQFKKGIQVWNKGKKGWCAPGCERTWFKKGHEPHNTNFDGHTRISKDGYLEVRVKKGEYKLLHRVVWEQEHGPVPESHCIVFKDNNPMNVRINNLKIITRADNMRRNSFINFPPQVRELIQVKKILTRNINKIQNHE